MCISKSIIKIFISKNFQVKDTNKINKNMKKQILKINNDIINFNLIKKNNYKNILINLKITNISVMRKHLVGKVHYFLNMNIFH
jgi:hypothetical protein